MGLNISKGNMYPFISHTWNTIKGRCPHGCHYCYMKQYGNQKDIRFDDKELKTNLGKNNFIFVGSSCDMWAEEIPKYWILDILDYCDQFENKYLFQSKNPGRMIDFIEDKRIPPDSTLGTTIETNRTCYRQMGQAPNTMFRADALSVLSRHFKTMVTVEPVMEFDLVEMFKMITRCKPAWVNIGADSKGHDLPEPTGGKVRNLINGLRMEGIKVKTKDNLKRIFHRWN